MGNEIFEKNLAAMEKWYPDFVKLIRKQSETKEDIDDNTEVFPETSWDGETIFRIKKGGQMLYLGGKRNAGEPIKMWSERIGEVQQYAPIFLFGIGSGLYFKEMSRIAPKEANLVIYEPSVRIFFTLLQEVDLSEEILARPVAFIIEGLNSNEFESISNKILVFENLDFLKEEIHPNYKEWYAEELKQKIKFLHGYAEGIVVQANTIRRFAAEIANNVLHNVKYVCDGYHTKGLMEAIPTNVPAILVSAGPSLNKNVHALKDAVGKAFILAVDTAIKPLLKAGICPDAFMTIDPQKPLHLVEGAEYIPVIAPSSANHALIARQKGKKIFYSDGYAIAEHVYYMNGKFLPTVLSGGSVACNAFSALHKMGFETIILVGQDLALTGNRTHADGTFQEKMPERDTAGLPTVKGNYEDKVFTRMDFRFFLDWFNDYIARVKERCNIRVVNATEGGAYIEGTEIYTLKDIIKEVCTEQAEKIDFSEKIEQMESAFSEAERKKAVTYLHNFPKEYEQIQKAAVLLHATYKKIGNLSRSGNIDPAGVRKLLKKIKKLTKQCQEKEAYQLIEVTIPTAEQIIRSEYYYEKETVEDELSEIARKGILYSQVLQECAELLKEMSEEALLSIA